MPQTNPTGQFAKQSAYNSGYGSTAYDALNQTAPDYNKTAYQSTGQQAKGHSATNQTGANSDIASSMYNKSHVTLNKVNVSESLKSRILLITNSIILCSRTTNNLSILAHRHLSTWLDRKLVRRRNLISSICTFSQWHRIITWTCISRFIRWVDFQMSHLLLSSRSSSCYCFYLFSYPWSFGGEEASLVSSRRSLLSNAKARHPNIHKPSLSSFYRTGEHPPPTLPGRINNDAVFLLCRSVMLH